MEIEECEAFSRDRDAKEGAKIRDDIATKMWDDYKQDLPNIRQNLGGYLHIAELYKLATLKSINYNEKHQEEQEEQRQTYVFPKNQGY